MNNLSNVKLALHLLDNWYATYESWRGIKNMRRHSLKFKATGIVKHDRMICAPCKEEGYPEGKGFSAVLF